MKKPTPQTKAGSTSMGRLASLRDAGVLVGGVASSLVIASELSPSFFSSNLTGYSAFTPITVGAKSVRTDNAYVERDQRRDRAIGKSDRS